MRWLSVKSTAIAEDEFSCTSDPSSSEIVRISPVPAMTSACRRIGPSSAKKLPVASAKTIKVAMTGLTRLLGLTLMSESTESDCIARLASKAR